MNEWIHARSEACKIVCWISGCLGCEDWRWLSPRQDAVLPPCSNECTRLKHLCSVLESWRNSAMRRVTSWDGRAAAVIWCVPSLQVMLKDADEVPGLVSSKASLKHAGKPPLLFYVSESPGVPVSCHALQICLA